MKQFKSFLSLTILLSGVLFSVKSNAQLRKKTTGPLSQGQYLDFGVTSVKDTLAVSDTIAYIIPMEHTNKVTPYLSFTWLKIGSGTGHVDLQFFQSNDGTNWFAMKAGVAQTAYAKSFTETGTTTSEVSFLRDTAQFEGRYMKIQFKTDATASVSGSVSGRLKTYWQ